MPAKKQGELSGSPSKISKNGSVYWRQRFFDANGKRREATGPTSAKARSNAQDKIDLSYNDEETVPIPVATKNGGVTLEQFIELYIERSREGRDGDTPLTEDTVRSYEYLSRLWINPQLGHKELTAISRKDCDNLRTYLIRNAPSRSTAKKIAVLFRAVMRYAVKCKKLRVNPAEHMTIALDWNEKAEKTEERILSMEEIERIDTAFKKRYLSNNRLIRRAYLRYYPMYLLLRMSGIRWSELAGLKWGDLDTDTSTLRIRRRVSRSYNNISQKDRVGRPKTKNGRRDIPIPADIIPYILEWKNACPKSPDNWMFCTKSGKAMTYQNFIHKCWLKVLEDAGIARTGIHTLRHVYASILLKKGKVKEASTFLGHHSVAFTMDQYAHLIPDDIEVLDGVRDAISADLVM